MRDSILRSVKTVFRNRLNVDALGYPKESERSLNILALKARSVASFATRLPGVFSIRIIWSLSILTRGRVELREPEGG